MFKLALAQMLVEGGKPEANLARAVQRIADAAGRGAGVVLLPETLDLGWTDPSARQLAEPIPDGTPCRTLRDAARRHGIYVCAGLVERAGDKVFNAAVLIDPVGQVLLTHRKLNEVTFALDVYDQGDRLGVVHTPLGCLGLMICADGLAVGQVVARTLGYMGADVILSPSAWAVHPDHDNIKDPYGRLWRDNYAPVARDFQLWIASVSNVGSYRSPRTGEDHPCIGCSMVFDPTGREALTGPYGRDADVILTIDIEPRPRPARACGWAERWKPERLKTSGNIGQTTP